MKKVYVPYDDLSKEFVEVECPYCGDIYLLDSNDVTNLINNKHIEVECSFCGDKYEICLG